MTEKSQKIFKNEVEKKRETLLISNQVWLQIVKKTRELAESSDEFFAIILENKLNPSDQKLIEVGSGHDSGVNWTAESAFVDISKHEGYKVIADVHNHPPKIADKFQKAGFPRQLFVGPSYSDLDSHVSQKLGRMLGVQQWPHIIVGIDGDDNDFHSTSYLHQFEDPTTLETEDWRFDDPDFKDQGDEEVAGIILKMLPDQFTNPLEVIKSGAIKLLDLEINGEENVTVLNSLDVE
jgi:hypothetical protein